jgi:hypothetical protein
VTFCAAKKEEEKTNPSKGVAAVQKRKGKGKKDGEKERRCKLKKDADGKYVETQCI